MAFPRRIVLYALSSLPIALIGLFARNASATANIYTISFYRLLIAALVLSFFLPFIDKKTFSPNKKHLPRYALIGFLIAVNFTIFNVANTLAPFSNVYLLASITPAIVLVLSAVYLREKVRELDIIVLLLTLVGIGIMNPITSATSSSILAGNILALIAGTTFAVIFTLMKKEDTGTGAGVTFWYFAFAALFALPLLLFGQEGIIVAFPWILGLGIISTALSWIATTLLLEQEPAGRVSIIQTILIPLTAVLVGWYFFSELPTIGIITGGALLVIAGVLLGIPHSVLPKNFFKPITKVGKWKLP